MPPDEIAALCADFSDAIARSPQLLQLLRNCSALGQWNAARRDRPAHRRGRSGQRGGAGIAAGGGAARRGGAGCRPQRSVPVRQRAEIQAVSRLAVRRRRALRRRRRTRTCRCARALAAHTKGDIDGAERGYRAVLTVGAGESAGDALSRRRLVPAQPARRGDSAPRAVASSRARRNPSSTTISDSRSAAADRHDDAIAAYRRALDAEARPRGRVEQPGTRAACGAPATGAIAAFREAVAREPDFAQAHWNLSLALLAHGDFHAGWREYEWRESIPELVGRERTQAGPRWDGVVREGLTLLVTAEQGLGDMLQFVRLAEPIARKGVQVLISAPKSLARLLATAPGVAHVLRPDDAPPHYDAHAPVLSLPGPSRSTPRHSRHRAVHHRGHEAARTGRRVAEPYAGRLKVGLAWQGSRHNPNDRHRSVDPRALSPLLALRGLAWFSLQRDEEDAEAAMLPGGRPRATAVAQRLRRYGGDRRGARSRRQRRHEHRPPRRRAREADLDPAAVRPGLALANGAHRQPVVSDGATLPATGAGAWDAVVREVSVALRVNRDRRCDRGFLAAIGSFAIRSSRSAKPILRPRYSDPL